MVKQNDNNSMSRNQLSVKSVITNHGPMDQASLTTSRYSPSESNQGPSVHLSGDLTTQTSWLDVPYKKTAF